MRSPSPRADPSPSLTGRRAHPPIRGTVAPTPGGCRALRDRTHGPRRGRAHHGDAELAPRPRRPASCATASSRSRYASGNELRQTGDPGGAAARPRRPRSTGSRRSTAPTSTASTEAAEIMARKNFAATGSFLAEDRPRALDLLGFASQLVFNTFHNRRLHDWEHGGDLDLAYGAARAHNRGMVEFCSADPRLLPTCYVPLADFDAGRGDGRRGHRDGRGRAAGGVGVPEGSLTQPPLARPGLGAGAGGRASRSSSTSAAPATSSTRATS